MFRILVGGAAVLAINAAAFAQSDEDRLAAACTAEGNEAAQCSCAADIITDTLEDNEVDFMLAVMDADTNQPADVMTIAADYGMDMNSIALMGQKMQMAEPRMREECGIEDAQ